MFAFDLMMHRAAGRDFARRSINPPSYYLPARPSQQNGIGDAGKSPHTLKDVVVCRASVILCAEALFPLVF